jgi:hypothetical protein
VDVNFAAFAAIIVVISIEPVAFLTTVLLLARYLVGRGITSMIFPEYGRHKLFTSI